ncbi:MICOS complex subunit mic60 [Sphaceloma murrayae]|uniref:MICOS complex subunit mic60 n=1 Tax=Sphaceloma murrayae TaxID=2082308 RepID=A0A2K1QJF2_9PEZI|nr:MICOS complex subunit mic60 [Sphaceloma murrayae]
MARPASPMGRSPSPPLTQMTKREKRRKNIVEKLQDMIQTFSRDQTQHYRAQLQAIQVDMTLILRADPYENTPLEDSPQHIEELIEALTGGNIPGGKAAKEDFYSLAGKRYFEYCQEINKAQEKRDADLAMLKARYDNASAELDRANEFKIQVAQREHVELSSTIRQRLINTVTKKRDRLMREKEQLDIADTSSLLLHPSHYTLNAPASPGGLHSNRKTRHTRNRLGDEEQERNKKRKLPGDEEGNDSPMPGYRPSTQDSSGAFSPYQEHKAKALRTQQEAPAYSIESIFTEKELAHATSVAQFATHHFFNQQQQPVKEPNGTNGQPNGKPATTAPGGTAESVADVPMANTEITERVASPPPPPQPEATGMERQVSNYATRGATRANPLSFLSDAAAAVSISEPVVNPFLPVMIPITKTDKGAPTPHGASSRDISMDLAIISGRDTDTAPAGYVARPTAEEGATDERGMNIGEVRSIFLEQACREPLATQPFRIPLTDLGPAMIKEGVSRPAAIGFADPASIPNGVRDGTAGPAVAAAAGYSAYAFAAGGLPMSRATSLGGSEMGTSEVGGVGMRRTRSRAV